VTHLLQVPLQERARKPLGLSQLSQEMNGLGEINTCRLRAYQAE
jgi:hypothetical protein